MNKYKYFFEYIRTFFITIFFVFLAVILLCLIVQFQVYREISPKKIAQQEENIDPSTAYVLIEQSLYLKTKYPKSYKIDLKLGTLYQIEKNYKLAEFEYKEAINKAPYNEYKPNYKLALLYSEQNRFADAQSVMDKIEEKPNKRLIRYKAEVYQELGNKYYSLGDYEDAIDKYRKSLFYWSIIKNKKGIKNVKDSLASACVYLAEGNLNQMDPEEAVKLLKTAISMVNAPVLKYKLALLVMDSDPNLAYQYFDEVFKKAPEIINYDQYAKFLSMLAANASVEGDISLEELYQYKIRRLQEYFKTNVLSINDIKLDILKNVYIKNKLFKRTKIYLNLKLKNTSQDEIGTLFLKVTVTDKGKPVDTYYQQIVKKDYPLPMGAYTPVIKIKMSKITEFDDTRLPPDIIADIYVAKTNESRFLHLQSIRITEKPSKFNKLIKKFNRLIQNILSRFPHFLEN